MHEENSSDGSLSLTVTFVGTIQTVSLQDVEEALLPESRNVFRTSPPTLRVSPRGHAHP